MKFNAKEWEKVESNDVIYTRLPAGGYVVKITKAEDIADKEYLRICYDIAEGQFKDFFAEEFYADKDYLHSFIRSYKETAASMFKSFYLAVQDSNEGFTFDGDETKLIGKTLGIVLGEEEYLSNNGETKTKLVVKRTTDAKNIREGNFKVPALKKLPKSMNVLGLDVNVDDSIPF